MCLATYQQLPTTARQLTLSVHDSCTINCFTGAPRHHTGPHNHQDSAAPLTQAHLYHSCVSGCACTAVQPKAASQHITPARYQPAVLHGHWQHNHLSLQHRFCGEPCVRRSTNTQNSTPTCVIRLVLCLHAGSKLADWLLCIPTHTLQHQNWCG